MNDSFDFQSGETHIEVHKFLPFAVAGVTVLGLFLQAFMPVYFPRLATLDRSWERSAAKYCVRGTGKAELIDPEARK